MLEEDDRETLYRDYTATRINDLLTMLIKRYTDSDYIPPSYLEMAHPASLSQPAKQTKEDAKAHVYKIFGIKEPERG